MLRDTIRYGLHDGDWDMKVGEKVYIKTDNKSSLPETIEFSDRMILYRRGILQPPEPRVIELNAQVMSNIRNRKTCCSTLESQRCIENHSLL